MNQSLSKQKLIEKEVVVLLVLVLVKLLIHLLTNAFASYGIFRDEFYYLACSHRLDAGYVDQPPLSIYILFLSRLLFGDTLFALRLLPAFAGALTVLISGLLVRKLGGRTPAVVIAGLAVIAAPILLGMNTVYSMNSFDILLWVLAAYILVLLSKEEKPKYWLLLGVVIGLGLLNKISMIWFALGLFAAVLLTRQRKSLKTPWPYLAGIIAIALFLPFITWNLLHDFAHLEFIRNATRWKYSSITPLDFILGQLLILQPVTLPVWLAGLYHYFFGKEGRNFRTLGIIYVTVFLILLVNGRSKPEYLSPAYPMLFAAGAVQFERLFRKRYWAWLKYFLPAVLVIGGMVTAPLALPCLPVQTYISYSKALGIAPTTSEAKELAELPQFYADMFGWENMANTVSQVYASLPVEEKSKTVIYAYNYGQAGAIEYYSRQYDLPPVISAHNNYWIWWGREHLEKDFQTVIILGGRSEDHLHSLQQVQEAGIIKCRYCMPYENNRVIFLGRQLKRAIKEVWQSDKHFE